MDLFRKFDTGDDKQKKSHIKNLIKVGTKGSGTEQGLHTSVDFLNQVPPFSLLFSMHFSLHLY